MMQPVKGSGTSALLLIGGIDSSGGAGITRDTAVAARFGIVPRVVVTAVTAQSDAQVTNIHPVSPESVRAQIEAASVAPLGAVKIGMLCDGRAVRTIAAALPAVPLILDPVLAASSGQKLIDEEGLECLLSALLPRTTLLTPNLGELDEIARRLGVPRDASEIMKVGACLRRGCKAVLVKGGHSSEAHRSTDRLYLKVGAPIAFPGRRFPFDLRGTGCHLATAIATGLCQGQELVAAIRRGKRDLAKRFRDAERTGEGRRAIEDRPVSAGMESSP